MHAPDLNVCDVSPILKLMFGGCWDLFKGCRGSWMPMAGMIMAGMIMMTTWPLTSSRQPYTKDKHAQQCGVSVLTTDGPNLQFSQTYPHARQCHVSLLKGRDLMQGVRLALQTCCFCDRHTLRLISLHWSMRTVGPLRNMPHAPAHLTDCLSDHIISGYPAILKQALPPAMDPDLI